MIRFVAITALTFTTTFAVTTTAGAQPGRYYAEPPPPLPPPYVAPPPVRRGLTLGFDLGVGGLEADSGPIRCDGCEGERAAGSLGFWIGGMLEPNWALLFHGSITGQALDDAGVETLVNATAMVAVKWWPTRRWWLKGGLGVASLGISSSFGDQHIADGGAGMLGTGFEIVHAPQFSVDLSLTATSSSYDEIDETITSGIVSLGLNLF